MVLGLDERIISKVLNNTAISKKDRDVLKKLETQERANGHSLKTIVNKLQGIEKFYLYQKNL